MKKSLYIGIALVTIIAVSLGFNIYNSSKSSQGIYIKNVSDKVPFYEESYATYLKENGFNGKMSNKEINIDLDNYITSEPDIVNLNGNEIETKENGKVTWEFEVEETGFYNLEIGYVPLKGTNSSIERKLYIDDKILFDGLNQLSFNRSWINETDEIEIKRNNEVRPNTIEDVSEKTILIEDSQKRVSEPYKFYLEKGVHTLSLEAVKEPMKITKMTFKSEEQPMTYSQFIEKNSNDYPIYTGQPIVGQAERVDGATVGISKSSRGILMNSNFSSPKLQPYHPYNTKFNTIGGDSWKVPGDSITWEIEAPEKGLYEIAITARQSLNRGGISYRRLMVNGKVPFQEANNLGFTFSSQFQNYIIGDGTNSYFIPLEKGVNTITLETILGEFDKAQTEVEQSLFVLNDTYRKIIQLTGTVPDQFIDYEIEKKIPNIKETFQQEANRLGNLLNEVIQITGEKGEKVIILEKLSYQLSNLAKDPNKVVKELDQLKSNISSLGLWSMEISSMPLEIDYITLGGENMKFERTKPNFAEKVLHESKRFLATIFLDETSFSEADKERKNIKVWISSGRDQAQVLMNLIEENFSATSDVNVQLELIPESVIIPATLAGEGPDVVIGLTEQQVMNFTIRNAVVDLSKFPDFQNEYEKYYPSAFEGVTYLDGIYGIPEQQTFMMMFYRKDILDELGLSIPKTWEDVKEIIPVLQTNNYDFYLPSVSVAPTLYPSLVYQNGGDMYLGKGKSYGIETGLFEESAMTAFKDLTQFFTSYQLAVSADFSNRFRTGEMPIGIAPYVTYTQLQVFASEIKGLWDFAPIPGVLKPNGEIDNTCVTATTQSLILNSAKDKEAAWEFVKWWTSEQTQLEYATTIESIMGTAARYPAANPDVIKQLPWTREEVKSLVSQLENTKGVPEVPGAYMTTRMVDYAFKNVVTDGQNPREALFLNSKTINKELTKKRQEFGLSTKKEIEENK